MFVRLVQFILTIGLSVVIVGFLLSIAPRVNGLKWMGHLPGDFQVRRGNTTLFIPIATCIVVSLALNVLFRVLRAVFPRLL